MTPTTAAPPIETDAPAPATTTTALPVAVLVANDYNPNEMTPAEFAELVAEVGHLGRLPKPVIVRANGVGGYVIVDGEHGWRAAKECGLTEIPCEIVDVDDFEARRQTFKRNQHGTHHPVRLGQMFGQMMTARGLSQRALAKEIEVSEGTIRNARLYAEAADVRNGYAFEKLTIRQVRAYLCLPRVLGDMWLKCGADLFALQNSVNPRHGLSQRVFRQRVDCPVSADEPMETEPWYAWLVKADLLGVLPNCHDGASFTKAVKQLETWYSWEGRWCICGLTRADVRPYTRHYFRHAWPVRDKADMDAALDLIIDTTGCKNERGGYRQGSKPTFHLTADEFETVILASESVTVCWQHLSALVLAKTGVPPGRNNKATLQRMELDIAKPAYLQGSPLPIADQHALWLAKGWTGNSHLMQKGPSVSLDEAKRELAKQPHIFRDGNESLDEAIGRHLRQYFDRAVFQHHVVTLTEAQMVEAIARRMPIYDAEKPGDRQAMAAMAATLMHLTRAELLCLFKYSEHLDWIKGLSYFSAALGR